MIEKGGRTKKLAREQAKDRRKWSEPSSSDVYSLGVCPKSKKRSSENQRFPDRMNTVMKQTCIRQGSGNRRTTLEVNQFKVLISLRKPAIQFFLAGL
jgi:hypothetical protein